MKKQNKLQKVGILLIIFVLLVGVAVVIVLNSGSGDYYQPESKIAQVNSTIVADSETIGWVNVQGTDIDYPVVYETNQVYQGLKDYLWLSNRFIEGNNRIAIFGHNIRNISDKPIIRKKDHVRFEQLLSFVYYDFAKNNLYIQYSQNDKDDLYKIYAVGFYNQDEEDGTALTEKDAVKKYIERVKENSIYTYKIDVNEDDFLISLVTCTRFFGASDKTSFKIDARRVRSGEKINKYGVQKSKNYDILNLE